ncbi:venom allergen 5-like [Onthophagus taurus]|uniref:venom allergen 5-like n=1 Tax=Onthophagus taurus TaxID=166361 RepID=UPI0039BE541C
MINLIKLFTFSTLINIVYDQTDFCKARCDLKINNCCRYNSVAKSCQESFKSIPLSNETLRNFVMKLNVMRNNVAGGLHERDEFKGVQASNMHMVSYSFELQYSSNCWATQCRVHLSRCKAVADGLVAETIFHRALKDNEPEDEQILFDSLDYFFFQARDYINISEYLENNLAIKEILRGPVQYVGCTAVVFLEFNIRVALVVCHYFPTVRKIGEKVFEKGVPCSKCDLDLKCSTQAKYQHLCGRTRPMFEDIWYPLFPPITNAARGNRKNTPILIVLFLISIN